MPRRRALLETLEPRVLLSADAYGAGAIAVGDLDNTTSAFVTSSGNVTTDGLLHVTASSTDTATTIADGTASQGSGSSVGVALGFGVETINTSAHVSGSGTVSASSMTIEALAPNLSAFSVQAISGASGGDTGVAGVLAINIGIANATASLDEGATITLTGSGDVSLTAQNNVTNSAEAKASETSPAKTGVGASVAPAHR
jgi:hypothetical protein